MKPKLAPHLFQILYTGIRKYICKYEDIAADEGPNIKSTKQFERIQSKYRIMEENEAAMSRKRKKSQRLNEPKYEMTPLFFKTSKYRMG